MSNVVSTQELLVIADEKQNLASTAIAQLLKSDNLLEPSGTLTVVRDEHGNPVVSDVPFLAQLLQIDEDMVDDLESVGIDVRERPAHPAHLEVLVNAILERAAYASREIALSCAAEDMEVQLVRAAHERRRSAAQHRYTQATNFALQLAETLDYGKRKSIELRFGKVGFKDHKIGAEVGDAEAARAWGITKLPQDVKVTIDLPESRMKQLIVHNFLTPDESEAAKRSISLSVVKKHALDTGEEVPGVDIVDAHREWFAKPANLYSEYGTKPGEPNVY